MPRPKSQPARERSTSPARRSAPSTPTSTAASGAAAHGLQRAQLDAAEMSAAEVAQVPRAAVSAFAPHPYNPPHRHNSAELADLGADIAANGLLNPLIVGSRARVVADDPRIADRVDPAARFVILAGHRRWGGAVLNGGVTELPYLIRDDLANRATIRQAMLRENGMREDLSPIEEARLYRGLYDEDGMSQAEIGEAVRMGQAHISKTLALLELPDLVQQDVDAGRLSANAGRQLLDLRSPEARQEVAAEYARAVDDSGADTAQARGEQLRRVVAAAKREAARAEAIDTARVQLLGEDLSVIDPAERFGEKHWQHRLTSAAEVTEEREAAELAGGHIDENGRITYYSRRAAPWYRKVSASEGNSNGMPAASSDAAAAGEDHSNGIAGDAQRDAAEAKQAAVDAAELRAEAVQRLIAAATKLQPAASAEILSDYALCADELPAYDGRTVAVEAGLIDADTPVDEVLGRPRAEAQRVAVATALGAMESEAARLAYADYGSTWPTVVRRHVRRLADLGHHILTEYDRQRLGED